MDSTLTLTRRVLYLIMSAICFNGIPALATPAEILSTDGVSLSTLPKDGNDPDSTVLAVSADGKTTVGIYTHSNENNKKILRGYVHDVASGHSATIIPTGETKSIDEISMSDDGHLIALSLCGNVESDSDCTSYLYDRDQDSYTHIDDGGLNFQVSALSPDGSIVVGKTNSQNGEKAHYRDSAGVIKPIPVEDSVFNNVLITAHNALDIAGDNNTIVGHAYNPGSRKGLALEDILRNFRRYDFYQGSRAFIYTIDSNKIEDIGTLRDDNEGAAMAIAISTDGSTVVGYAETNRRGQSKGPDHAFSYDVASKAMKDIGALPTTNGGDVSRAMAVNQDGSVIVGHSSISDRVNHAFYYDAKTGTMTDLGTLSGNPDQASSAAFAVNADGSVVFGTAKTSARNAKHALVWKVKRDDSTDLNIPPTPESAGTLPPVTVDLTNPSSNGGGSGTPQVGGVLSNPGSGGSSNPQNGGTPASSGGGGRTPAGSGSGVLQVNMVDVTNSRKTFVEMARKDHALQDLYSGNLDNLATMHCSLENNAYCIGAFGVANRVDHGDNLMNTGIHGALRLSPQWSAGMSLAYLADDTLPGGIESRGRHAPGVGAYLRYAENPDDSGLRLTASTAYQEQKLAIRRSTIGQTEPGSGDSAIEGTLFALDGAYGIKLSEGTLLSPTVGLDYRKTHRKDYSETRQADFPAEYGKSGERSTELKIGIGLDHALSPQFSLHGAAGTRIVLNRDRDPFTVHADNLGGGNRAFDLAHSGEKERVMPYANAGLSARWGANNASLARLRVGIAKSDYGNNDANIGFSYDYRF